jgi:hypothetical protein
MYHTPQTVDFGDAGYTFTPIYVELHTRLGTLAMQMLTRLRALAAGSRSGSMRAQFAQGTSPRPLSMTRSYGTGIQKEFKGCHCPLSSR